jgi:hypothetical protein
MRASATEKNLGDRRSVVREVADCDGKPLMGGASNAKQSCVRAAEVRSLGLLVPARRPRRRSARTRQRRMGLPGCSATGRAPRSCPAVYQAYAAAARTLLGGRDLGRSGPATRRNSSASTPSESSIKCGYCQGIHPACSRPLRGIARTVSIIARALSRVRYRLPRDTKSPVGRPRLCRACRDA